MSKVLLDTDILSEYLKGHDLSVVSRSEAYAKQHGVFTFTSVTVHEIVYGLGSKGAYAQLAKVSSWLAKNEEITPAAEDFVGAALLKAGAKRQGNVLELSDCLIAAVAMRLDLPLVTGNTYDFQAMQRAGAKLVIANWREEASEV